jgi:hypothetical protein
VTFQTVEAVARYGYIFFEKRDIDRMVMTFQAVESAEQKLKGYGWDRMDK